MEVLPSEYVEGRRENALKREPKVGHRNFWCIKSKISHEFPCFYVDFLGFLIRFEDFWAFI